MKKKYLIALGLLIGFSLLIQNCKGPAKSSFDLEIKKIAAPYEFQIAPWEIKNVFAMAIRNASRLFHGPADAVGGAELVWRYFSTDDDENVISSSEAEAIIGAQIESILREEDILSSFLFWQGVFPPLSFMLEEPPEVLVISPRDKITIKKTILLEPRLKDDIRQNIEEQTDRLGASSVAINLSGLALYPNLINPDQGIKESFKTTIHEWFHHYLFFKPVGFKYDATNYDLTVINETIADMAAQELTGIIMREYYPQSRFIARNKESPEPAFDINLELRDIRKEVNRLLGRGQIEAAESYMREKRDFLEANGHRIRKLNQAWFAFQGTYAAAQSVENPIGDKLREIRKHSASLKDFLDKVSIITSSEDLGIVYQDIIQQKPD